MKRGARRRMRPRGRHGMEHLQHGRRRLVARGQVRRRPGDDRPLHDRALRHALVDADPGRAGERPFGGRRMGLLALGVIAVFARLSMLAPAVGLAIADSGADRVRHGPRRSSPAAPTCARAAARRRRRASSAAFGLAGGGLALAVVPQVEGWIGWRAPYATAVAWRSRRSRVLALRRADARRPAPDARAAGARASSATGGSIASRRCLRRLARAQHHGRQLGRHAARTARRPRQGRGRRDRVADARPRDRHAPVRRLDPAGAPGAGPEGGGASLVAGAAGTRLLAVAAPPALAVAGAALIGVAAGIPFAPSFTGAAVNRPDAPAAAVGFVNGAARVGDPRRTPLLGLCVLAARGRPSRASPSSRRSG